MKDINNSKHDFHSSYYTEIYSFDDRNKCLLINEETNEIYIKKKLDVYNESVISFLKKNNNIHFSKILDYWKDNNQLIVIEEYIQGKTLDKYLENHTLTNKEKEKIILDICDGLYFLHTAEPPIIHRDLKPSNILIDKDNIVKIIDYDAAKEFKKGLKRDTVLIGTPGVAAPEQYGFAQSDVRTDIYSLGLLIKQLFPNDSKMLKISEKATKMDPNYRYSSVINLKSDIENPSLKLALLPIPGFRTNNTLNKIISILGYGYILYLTLYTSITINDKPATGLVLIINRICILFMFLSMVDLVFDWTHFFHNIPWVYSSNKTKSIIAKIIGVVLIFFIFALIASLAESIFA